MAIDFKFFNSKNHDRKYNAADWADYFASFVGNGVFADPASSCQIVADSGLTVKASVGCAWINGYMAKITVPEPITLAAAGAANPRIDRIVARVDLTQRCILLAAVAGTAEAAPALTRNGSIYEIGLATVAIAKNATAITQANITDTRADSDVCGWVTGLLDQIDATGLFAQYNAAFSAWFANLQSQLDSNQAAHLQNQIDALDAKIDGTVALYEDAEGVYYND